jgi:hypothetical protein
MLQKLKHKRKISKCTRTARHIASLNKPISRIRNSPGYTLPLMNGSGQALLPYFDVC